jgi:uncharacterized protein (TIGR00299 family) protein
MKQLIIDPGIDGIAGDMLIASLVDLTGDPDPLYRLAEAINTLKVCERFDLEVNKTDGCGISATCLGIGIREEGRPTPAALRMDAARIAAELGLSPGAAERIDRILDDLTVAHDRLHSSGFSRHQVASVDTLFDAIGSVLMLEEGGYFDGRIYGLPPVIGRGMVRTGGGEMAGPAPATLEILCRHHVPYSARPAETELTTPTGAALLAGLSDEIVDCYPSMTPLCTGYGAGTRMVGGRHGLLRVVEGENSAVIRDRIVMLETNLDDVSGEEVGYTIERLFEEGAVDVFVTPAIGKKNRPVQVISVITDHQHSSQLIATLMGETGTLGVRVSEIPRLVADRSRTPVPFTIAGRVFEIRVKTSTVDGRMISVKPEYDDLRRAARELQIPLRHVATEVKKQLPGIYK